MNDRKELTLRFEASRGARRAHPACATYGELEKTLAVIKTQLRSFIQADTQSCKARRMMNRVRSQTERADPSVDEVVSELWPVLLDTQGMAATLEWYAREFQKCTGIFCGLTITDAAGFEMPGKYAAAIFDIYRESLHNVARHAQPNRIEISITIWPHEIAMIVRDGRASAQIQYAQKVALANMSA
jgi:signal transduction histidine kinase